MGKCWNCGKENDDHLKGWRKLLKPGDQVYHIADWKLGIVVRNPSTHPMYELDVEFDGEGISPCYAKNLFPEWWPAPGWVTAKASQA